MSIALQMTLVVKGMFMSPIPTGQLVTSRADCVTLCYRDPVCFSVFYDTSSKECYLHDKVLMSNATDLVPSNDDMEYLTLEPDTRVCIVGYTLSEELNVCYKLYPGPANWNHAETQCIQDGGHLLKVDTAVKNTFVIQLCLDTGLGEIWIGGSFSSVFGDWTWADNSSFNYTHWHPLEPNLHQPGACVRIWCSSNPATWRDEYCPQVYPYVCETSLKKTNLC